MPNVANMLQNMPWWAFVLLALLVVLGVQALQPRMIAVWRLLIVPATFIGWGVISLVTQSVASPILMADWLATAAAGAAIAWGATRLEGMRIDRPGGHVQIPGSVFPLMRNLVIFAAKYGLTVATTMAPSMQMTLSLWNIAVSGLSAGYFIGWLLRFALKYRTTPEPQTGHPVG
ncbi:MAG TPA: DUF6622 family protein [Stellaceae bacterium]|jgi:hypothetical protein|nr:DUF6622 family protein [Stellaceae bacterium]